MELNFKSGKHAALWKPEVAKVYLLFGEEDRLKEEAVAALTGRVVSLEFADFDLETLDALRTAAPAILAAAGQAPFGSDRRMVIVRGMEQWRERAKATEVERLAEGIGRLPTTACLVLVAGAEEEEAKRKTAVSVRLDNAVKKAGVVVACRALRGDELTEWVTDRFTREGKRLQPGVAAQIIEAVGTEMRPLEQEIQKLLCYAWERGSVTGQDVSRVVASSPEDVMFTVVETITRRDADTALKLLAELHRFDPRPHAVAGRLLVLLTRQYRMLWQAKFLSERRVSPRDVRNLPPELASELPAESSIVQLAFKAGALFAQSNSYTWDELADAMDVLLRCDLANKGGATDESGVFGSDLIRNLQLLVLQLSSGSQHMARRA